MLAFLILLAATARGSLCVEAKCLPANGSQIWVAASETPRPFVWIEDDAKRVVLGTVPAGASNVRLDDPGLSHSLAVQVSDQRFRPAAFLFELRSRTGAVWTWSLPRLPKAPMELRHPPGKYTLTVSAKGYRVVEKQVTGAGSLGPIYLHRLPVLTGRVIEEATLHPLAGAHIALATGESSLAMTDANGRFEMTIEGAWPALIRVSYPGRAVRLIDVPKTVADTELPTIALGPGGVIHTTFSPLGNEEIGWDLRRITGQNKSAPARKGQLAAGQTDLVIDGVAAGSYVLVISGTEPLQKFGMPVTVIDGRVSEAKIEIEPCVIEMQVMLDDAPIASASVDLRSLDGGWEGHLTMNDDGRAAAEVWQQGDYLAIVSSSSVPAWTGNTSIAGDGRIPLTLRIPGRSIRGRVLNTADGTPVGDAQVTLNTAASGGGGLMYSVRTDAEGTFQFSGVIAGEQTLTVHKKGFESRQWRFSMGEEDRLETRELLVAAAQGRRTIVVSDSRGAPMPGAIVYLATSTSIRRGGTTDGDGKLPLDLYAGEKQGVLFAVPRSGSFGILRATFGQEAANEPLVVRVADGSVTLELRTESVDGDPVPRVPILLRVDGTLIPDAVMSALRQSQGVPLRSDDNGRAVYSRLPPGHYEIWAVTSRAELEALYMGIPPPPALRIALVPGQQSAILKFKPREGT